MKLLAAGLIFLPSLAFGFSSPIGGATFESGALGATASGSSGFSYASSNIILTNEQVNTGTKAAKGIWPSGSAEAVSAAIGYPTQPTDGGEIWQRGYFYFKSPWDWTATAASGGVVKIFRINVKDANDTHIGYVSIFAAGATSRGPIGSIMASNEVASAVEPSTGVMFDIDKWQCLEMYTKFSVTAPVTRIWKNGVLIYEDIANRTLRASTDRATRTLVMSYWNSGVHQDQVQYFDDFVVTTDTPANRDTAGNLMIGPLDWGDITPSVTTANPPSGTYTGSVHVTLSANDPGAVIYYTLDGTPTTTASSVYSGPITIPTSTTLKWFSRDAAGEQETVQCGTYTILPPSPDSPPTAYGRIEGFFTGTFK